jgi:hypothetical protein
MPRTKPKFIRRRDGTETAKILVEVEVDKRNWPQVVEGAKALKCSWYEYLKYHAGDGVNAAIENNEEE